MDTREDPHEHELDQPVDSFSQCHAGFTAQLRELRELPALQRQAQRSRDIAERSSEMFGTSLVQHHSEEEADLFPAVLRSAQAGEEGAQVSEMIERLTNEHRKIEKLWKQVAGSVKGAARNRDTPIDPAALEEFITACFLHANFEEQYFLPLAERILGRNENHMAALGMSLHLRHARVPPIAYI